MTEAVSYICFIPLGIATLLALWRLLAGPTVLDRIIGFDLLTICTMAVGVLISIRWKTGVYIEIMLIFSLLGFVGTVAFISYLHRDLARRWARHEPQQAQPSAPPRRR